jgi:propionate CoA-transferase
MNVQIMTAEEAVAQIKSGDTIVTSGFLGMSCPEEISEAIERSYLEYGIPNNLRYVFPSAQGDQDHKAVNRFAHKGLIRRIIGGHYNLAPKMIQFILDEQCEAYNLPQGTMLQWLRAIGSGRPGLISRVGLKTFVDPRVEGGKLNKTTKEDIVELIEFKGKEYLYYPGLSIDVGIIRGTTSDEQGNITIEREGHHNESLLIAQATKNTGGIVIAQVERIAKYGTLDPRQVVVPGINVDIVVVAKPENHMQSNTIQYDPAVCGETKALISAIEALPFNVRKVIARRAAMELSQGDIVNLGIGMPEGVAKIAVEEDIDQYIKLTVEAGGIGGVPLGGIDFGAVINPEALIPHVSIFDFYDGGGLDVAFLGLAQADGDGNVNVSKFNGRIAGCGGFVNITQNAKKVVFLGTLTAGGLRTEIENGSVQILQEGNHKKLIPSVEQITFSGEYAMESGQEVLYITERAVFELREDGLHLTEIAPGIDIERDILTQVDCTIRVGSDVKQMDPRLFRPEKMNLKIACDATYGHSIRAGQ